MKKNAVKKLRLSRETLRELEEKASRNAMGGTSFPWPTYESCQCDALTNYENACA